MEDKNKESIRDTLLDLMGYAFIGLAMEDDDWHDGDKGVKSHVTRMGALEGFEELFADKLEKYGTKDLWSLEQIVQRMREKLFRVESMSTGSRRKVLTHHIDPEHKGILYPQMDGDVGYDLVTSEEATIQPLPSKAQLIRAGVHIKIPEGYFAKVVGRSSAANKYGLLVHTATIDNGYTGEMFVCCWNMTGEPVIIKKGTRLAQVIFLPITLFTMEEVEELPDTERSQAGFGSTGE